MMLELDKVKHMKAGMLDPSVTPIGLKAAEMLDLLTLAINGLEAMHAAAPPGHKCADCTIDDVPCPICYDAAWRKRHPAVMMLSEQAVRLPVPPIAEPPKDP